MRRTCCLHVWSEKVRIQVSCLMPNLLFVSLLCCTTLPAAFPPSAWPIHSSTESPLLPALFPSFLSSLLFYYCDSHRCYSCSFFCRYCRLLFDLNRVRAIRARPASGRVHLASCLPFVCPHVCIYQRSSVLNQLVSLSLSKLSSESFCAITVSLTRFRFLSFLAPLGCSLVKEAPPRRPARVPKWREPPSFIHPISKQLPSPACFLQELGKLYHFVACFVCLKTATQADVTIAFDRLSTF